MTKKLASDLLTALAGKTLATAESCTGGGIGQALGAYAAISVTGLAGPDGDDRGNPVGTVFIGYRDPQNSAVRKYHFSGSRGEIRQQAVEAALCLALSMQH